MFHQFNLAIFLGNGNGTFQNRTLYSQPASWRCIPVDLNNDGYPEVVSSNVNTSKTFCVFRNLGNGLFADRVSYPSAVNETMFAASGDLNNDGKNDLVFSCANSKVIAVHINTTP
ncbi:MAG: VCBS repeat-containing protein [Armatimonas sp.]